MVGERPDVVAKTASVVDDVQGERQLPCEPPQVFIDAGRLPFGVCEDGAVGHAVERTLTRHQGEYGGLDATAEADYRQAGHGE